jgi:hypothetical protein
MGSVGDAYDNALCESFFATLECELLDRRRLRTQAEASSKAEARRFDLTAAARYRCRTMTRLATEVLPHCR